MLDAINLNDGESCPGAERCRRDKRPGNLWKYPEADEERVCRQCELFTTKPEQIPEELAPHAAEATDLAELQRSGARFQYPAALSPVEWAALTGLTRGRDRAESRRQARERKEAKGSRNRK